MLLTIQEMADLGIIIALFAFTPVRGTRLEKLVAPSLESYRRIQAARYLILKGVIRFENIKFEAGRLSYFGLEREQLLEILAEGEAFRTSGCPDCNRPYYNEKPGGVIYNYALPLTEPQKKQATLELGL